MKTVELCHLYPINPTYNSIRFVKIDGSIQPLVKYMHCHRLVPSFFRLGNILASASFAFGKSCSPPRICRLLSVRAYSGVCIICLWQVMLTAQNMPSSFRWGIFWRLHHLPLANHAHRQEYAVFFPLGHILESASFAFGKSCSPPRICRLLSTNCTEV